MRIKQFHIFTTVARANAYIARVEQQLDFPLPARKASGDIIPNGTQTTKYAEPMENKVKGEFAVRETTAVAAANVLTTKELDAKWLKDAQPDTEATHV